MLNSTEHENSILHKNLNTEEQRFFSCLLQNVSNIRHFNIYAHDKFYALLD